MPNPKQELQELLEILQIEKKEDYEAYKKLVQSLSLSERKQEGYTWQPVRTLKTGYTIGEKAFVIIERQSMVNHPHLFRSGMPVRFYTQFENSKKPERKGVINYLEKNRMKIILNAKELPDWIADDQLGVDILFDDRTYFEMEKALNTVIQAHSNRLAELRDILLGKQPPRFDDFRNINPIPNLNPSQQEAVRNITSAKDVAVVHGPPGTGKTTTLVHAIQELLKTETTVLVTAPSNTAADLLAERLAEKQLAIVRLGHISRVDDEIIKHTLEAQLAQHPESKHIKKVKIQAAEARRNARRFKRKFDRQTRNEQQNLRRQARELSTWARQLEDRLIELILDGAQAIISTLVGVSNKVLEKRKFKTVVIDEAAQALEPATWIAIIKASKVVLAGDPFQLPPTVKSFEAHQKGLGVTLIEKCLQRLDRINLLTVQYRMHSAIMDFSNRQFYKGILKADPSVASHELPGGYHPSVQFIDTAGCGFEEQRDEEAKSLYNPEEYLILCEHLYQLVERFSEEDFPEIALISPYREQVIHIRTQFYEDEKLKDLPIQINTIDSFQGQERDVIYISMVRSNPQGEIGFLSDFRRMNVAMTRARKLLVVVGDSGTLGAHEFYKDFFEYVEKHGQYRSAWDYIR